MDELNRILDDETFGKLVDNKITDASLAFLDQEILDSMGIVAMGPKLIIMSVVNNLNETKDTISEVANPSTSSTTPAKDLTVREILESHPKFRSILQDKLDAKIVPKENELKLMVRVLCAPIVERLTKESVYPTTEEKKKLVAKILQQFPFLNATKRSVDGPEYSLFFWKNGGQGAKHEHTGLIQTHLRNACKNLLPEQRKFTHSPKSPAPDSVSTEMIELAENCARYGQTSANYPVIAKIMSDVHDLHMMLLREKKDIQSVLRILPHLISYNGRMVIISVLSSEYFNSFNLINTFYFPKTISNGV
ncbi:uncharacterized protein LOC131680572 [Topomyia yanbarensis]|uniref:uncharacterized protein LOC131680572 n=1 Tax=Topomyia yanbarensis TaxID=2498891 RepID=UPI00273BFDCA|nr:uncharacterized protein LOC131680572 [Topomyia yanbarensis]